MIAPAPLPDLRTRLIAHMRKADGTDISWAAESLRAGYVEVEDVLDAMVEAGTAFKDGSFDPAVYHLKGGSTLRG